MKKIQAAEAMVRILTEWDVDHIYGIPGSSTNSLMRALKIYEDKLQYIQVRHEEAGALAASVDAKLTGKIGVCFGSGGPGHTHLINGMYDAKFDRVPMLVITGSTHTRNLGTDYFQEMDPVPLYSDVSVFNRFVTEAEQLPFVIDNAIRTAYRENGVAIVHVPVDIGYTEIDDNYISSANAFEKAYPQHRAVDIDKAVHLIQEAKRPVIFAGRGTHHAQDELRELSEKFAMPVVLTFLGKGAMPDAHPNMMGQLGRLGSKSSNEAIQDTDLIVMVGAEYPFGREMFPQDIKSIQINIDPKTIGKRLPATVGILGDSKAVMREIIEKGQAIAPTQWLKANQINRKNWLDWIHHFENDLSVPMRPEPIMKALNETADDDAIFIVDVGNNVILSSRELMFTGKQKLTTSGIFATMGIGTPGGIAARLSYPEREVYTLSGDGAFAMMMQEYMTQLKYNLPMVNIVICNESYGFIQVAQEMENNDTLGVDLTPMDYAKFAEACGGVGYHVETYDELMDALTKSKGTQVPVIIDVKVANVRHLPAHAIVLDESLYSKEEVATFKEKYEVFGMPVLREILKDLN
ncbi:pyruvate oxidase [Erysipelothrix sp. HDW6B]|uniref:pyruvate oxidase n=1 Tax=Erysipelothrix sp. HDW6B TaxID=2714929 RepID=UPI00140A8FFA|nr:pyruvate oxidase [Erysipelothrix sp. HDW6B]QIK85598.1 pyruvate oxidase [Erysipelothrix sp. HDW6B]